MLSSAHGAELLDQLVEHLALLQGQYFGHINQCADQILANLLGVRKALAAQCFKRGPVDRVGQEQIMNFFPVTRIWSCTGFRSLATAVTNSIIFYCCSCVASISIAACFTMRSICASMSASEISAKPL